MAFNYHPIILFNYPLEDLRLVSTYQAHCSCDPCPSRRSNNKFHIAVPVDHDYGGHRRKRALSRYDEVCGGWGNPKVVWFSRLGEIIHLIVEEYSCYIPSYLRTKAEKDTTVKEQERKRTQIYEFGILMP